MAEYDDDDQDILHIDDITKLYGKNVVKSYSQKKNNCNARYRIVS